MTDFKELREALGKLKDEHRSLDVTIQELEGVSAPDRVQVQRLKKRKLQVRDMITQIEGDLVPDIIA